MRSNPLRPLGRPRPARVLACVLMVAACAVAAPPLGAAQLPSIELEVELDPATRRFDAVAVVRPEATDFRFVLHESLAVSAAQVGDRPLAVAPAGRDGALRGYRVSLPARGALRLHYGGTLPALDRALDHRDVLRGLMPMAADEGSFLPAGGAWYPRPAPLFSYRVALSVPETQRALVAGRLVSETVPAASGARYRARFEFAQATDGIDLMAGPWRVREQLAPRAGAEPLRLRTYFPAALDAIDGLAAAYLDDTRRYIERYSEAIGPYPYAGFAVVASPLPTGFGMPSLTYIGAEVLKLPFIRATSLGHEVLHNWWGNGVLVDYGGGNWSEGLTTFMADYAYKEAQSADAAREMRLGWLRDFAAVPDADQQPLAMFRSRTHGAAAAVGYGKSSMLFVMLRDLIGEDAFARGIRTFWDRQRFRVAGWGELRAAFEAAAGRSLADFFDQWLERAGAPAVRIEQARASLQAGRVELTLDLVQSAPDYALSVPVEVVHEDGGEIHRVALQGTRARVTIALPAMPLGVRLDPGLRLWRVLAPEQLPPILRQWVVAGSPRLALAGKAARAQADEAEAAALALAQRLFEREAKRVALDALDDGGGPVLLIGLHDDVDAALAQAGLPARSASVGVRGSAQVWTLAPEGGAPVAVVSAKDAESLRALMRPLPHYGSQSWLVFEGSRAVDRGVWSAPGRIVPVTRAD